MRNVMAKWVLRVLSLWFGLSTVLVLGITVADLFSGKERTTVDMFASAVFIGMIALWLWRCAESAGGHAYVGRQRKHGSAMQEAM